MQKKAEKDLHNLVNTPTFKATVETAQRISKAVTPYINTMEQNRRILSSKDMKILLAPSPRPVTREEIEYLLSQQGSRNKIEILYTKDKKLERMAGGKLLTYEFFGNAKRINVFESILENRAVPTAILRKIAKCPSDYAIRKLISDINKTASYKLKIKRLLKFSYGLRGYVIYEELNIIPE